MRKVFEFAESGDERAQLALNMTAYRLMKYIGGYNLVVGGAQALIFTAGIGENSSDVRADVISGMTWFGVDVDPAKNVSGAYGVISTDQARVKAVVIPTDEELVIARDVERFKHPTN